MDNFSSCNLKRLAASACLSGLLSLALPLILSHFHVSATDVAKTERVSSVEALIKTVVDGQGDEDVAVFAKIAREGNDKAAVFLGDLYGEGRLAGKDLKQALSFYEAAFAVGEISVTGKIGDLYYRHYDELAVEQSKALSFYTTIADAGNAWAMSRLVDVYRDGKIVPVDLKKALEFYSRALEKGSNSATTKLGDLYYRHADA